MTAEQAYDEVCRIAREHALIWQASGGVVVIVHPDTQKAEGLYGQIQWMHGLGPHPSAMKGEDGQITGGAAWKNTRQQQVVRTNDARPARTAQGNEAESREQADPAAAHLTAPHRRTTERGNMKALQIRQGDVFLRQVDRLPDGAVEVPAERGRIVLAYGEVTGHAHAIADHADLVPSADAADEIVEALIARCRAKLYEHNGDRYLVVNEPVSLTHEEHTAHTIPPGVYEIPVQMEYDAAMMRRVAD